jgi:hypothetical protein
MEQQATSVNDSVLSDSVAVNDCGTAGSYEFGRGRVSAIELVANEYETTVADYVSLSKKPSGDSSAIVETGISGISQRTAVDDANVCKYFSKGYCSRGSGCYFIHVVPAPKLRHPDTATRAQATSESTSVCRYFLMGRCRNQSCPFSHVLPDASVSRANKYRVENEISYDAGAKRKCDDAVEIQSKAKEIIGKRSFRKFVDECRN